MSGSTDDAHGTRALIGAAVALADTLARENAALAELDLPAAMALLAQKQREADAFAVAHARAAAALARGDGGSSGSDLAERQWAETVGARLRELAGENKRLLERAMRVQGRVIGSIAQALPRAMAGPARYDAGGGIAGSRRPPPVALSARA